MRKLWRWLSNRWPRRAYQIDRTYYVNGKLIRESGYIVLGRRAAIDEVEMCNGLADREDTDDVFVLRRVGWLSKWQLEQRGEFQGW